MKSTRQPYFAYKFCSLFVGNSTFIDGQTYICIIFLLLVDQIYHLASPASPPHYMYNPIKVRAILCMMLCCYGKWANFQLSLPKLYKVGMLVITVYKKSTWTFLKTKFQWNFKNAFKLRFLRRYNIAYTRFNGPNLPRLCCCE